jgi:hypothetical protein
VVIDQFLEERQEDQRGMKLHCLISVVAVALIINLAQAGPPFVTDDPEPPPPGDWEINVPVIVERTQGTTDLDAPLVDLNYGLPNVQLKLEFPLKILEDGKTGTSVGPGDLLLGVKWRFFNNEETHLQVGTYPQLLLPTGDHARGLGQGQPAYLLPLLAQKSWDKWTFYGNVGYWWQTGSETRNYFYAGAVLEREINDRLTLGMELFGNSPREQGGRSEIGFNVGGMLKLCDHFNLLFAGGRNIAGDTMAIGYIGLQILTK